MTDRQSDRQTETDRERETDRETQTDRQTETETETDRQTEGEITQTDPPAAVSVPRIRTDHQLRLKTGFVGEGHKHTLVVHSCMFKFTQCGYQILATATSFGALS